MHFDSAYESSEDLNLFPSPSTLAVRTSLPASSYSKRVQRCTEPPRVYLVSSTSCPDGENSASKLAKSRICSRGSCASCLRCFRCSRWRPRCARIEETHHALLRVASYGCQR